jgi:hypothetical protein
MEQPMTQEEVQRHYNTNIGYKYPVTSQYPTNTIAQDEDNICESCSGRICTCS